MGVIGVNDTETSQAYSFPVTTLYIMAVKLVRSSRVSSFETNVKMDCRASYTGVQVKRLTKLRLTIRLLSLPISFFILCAEFSRVLHESLTDSSK